MTAPLDISNFIYNTGTLTIAPGDTTATITGVPPLAWVIKPGDYLFAGGSLAVIQTVTEELGDDQHLGLFSEWAGDAVTSSSYVIIKASIARYDSVLAAYETNRFLSFLDDTPVFYRVTGEVPDPSIGEEGQWALNTNVTPWKIWLKTGGVWVLQAGSPGEKGDKGDKGDTGDAGTDGTDGAPGADGTDGQGVPAGGAAGQILAKTNGTDFNTEWVDLPEGDVTSSDIREKLTANRAYYVRTDGSDSNNGLANTTGGAFLTIQKAIDTVYTLDLSIYNVTIQLADGTYSGSVAFKGPFVGKGSVTLNGNSTTPTNVVVSIPNSYGAFGCRDGVQVSLTNFQIAPQSGTAAQNILIQNFVTVMFAGVDFAASGRAHIEALNFANVVFSGAWTISGDAPVHITLDASSNMTASGQTVTASGGTRTFSDCFLKLNNRSGALIFNLTKVGTFSGVKWKASLNATINSIGATSDTAIPGSTNGTASTGAQAT